MDGCLSVKVGSSDFSGALTLLAAELKDELLGAFGNTPEIKVSSIVKEKADFGTIFDLVSGMRQEQRCLQNSKARKEI